MKDQTIREYARKSDIPLSEVMGVFERKGLSCKADDVLTKELRFKLTRYFTPEVIKAIRAERNFKREEQEARKKKIKEEKEEQARKIWEENIVSGLKVLGKVIDVCIELLPNNKKLGIKKHINFMDFSEFLCISFLDDCKNINHSEYYNYKQIYSLYSCSTISMLSDCLDNFGRRGYFEANGSDFTKTLLDLRRNNEYTAGLCLIILILIKNGLFFDNSHKVLINYRILQDIGEFVIDMGATENALTLYSIDKEIFCKSNSLSMLIDKSLKKFNLEESKTLLNNLIEKEPYHPSIQIFVEDIKRLERMDKLKSEFSIDFEKISELSGVEFEKLLLDKFEFMGFKVHSTPKTGDYGADLIIENNEGTRIIVQCKRFKSKVNLKAVQEVVGAMGHYAGDIGLVITNNLFLNSAIKLAESHDIELWNGDNLVSFLSGDLSFSKKIKNI